MLELFNTIQDVFYVDVVSDELEVQERNDESSHGETVKDGQFSSGERRLAIAHFDGKVLSSLVPLRK